MEPVLMPFQFSFMNQAFLIVSIISLPTSLLSCYLVLKGWSLMGDAISHAVLPGVVLAYLLNIPLVFGAFSAGMVCAVVTGFLSDYSRIKRDTIMGVVFSGMFALGIVLYTKISTDMHLDNILFGNMLGISIKDLWITGSISLLVSLIIIFKRYDLLLHSFDPIQAQAVGIPVKVLHYGLLALISLTIVATLSSVGIILSIGLLIAPGAISFLITKRFEIMLIIAFLVTLASGILGVYISFFIDSAPAPTIILILTFFFIIAFINSTKKPSKEKIKTS
ncbi:MAG: metal ABC transporter permease [Paracoccaceae bacterium]